MIFQKHNTGNLITIIGRLAWKIAATLLSPGVCQQPQKQSCKFLTTLIGIKISLIIWTEMKVACDLKILKTGGLKLTDKNCASKFIVACKVFFLILTNILNHTKKSSEGKSRKSRTWLSESHVPIYAMWKRCKQLW